MSVLFLAQIVGLTASGSLAQAIGLKNASYVSAGMPGAIAAFGRVKLERR